MSTQSNNQIVPFKAQVNEVRALLTRTKDQFAMALPRHLKVEQFLRVAMTTIQKNPDLLKCTQTSLVSCLMESAQLGLQVDGILGEAYLVPFNNKQKDGSWRKECQLMIGYRGFMKLARNSGEVSTIKAEVVYKSDRLELEDGLDPKLIHVRSEQPPVEGDENLETAVRGAYAVAKMKDGSDSFVFLWKWEIDRARQFSKQADGKTWRDNYPEMAKKTAIRRLAKYMPQSPEIQKAAVLDELADAGVSQELGDAIDVSLTQGAITDGSDNDEHTSKLDQLADAGQKAAAPPPEPPKETAQPKQEPPKGKPASKPADPQGNPNYGEGADPDPFAPNPGKLFGK